jgi:hypothetical protein
MLKVSRSYVYKQIHTGRWDCHQPSPRVYRFDQDQWEAILDGRARAGIQSTRRLDDALAKLTA